MGRTDDPDGITFGTASTDAHLEGILSLQRRNLEESLSPAEATGQGFVTARHDLALLRDMNAAQAHAIATLDGEVVAYALAMARAFEWRIPQLDPMYAALRQLRYRDRPLDGYRYFLMGQVCVGKPYRGYGVFDGLYRTMRRLYGSDYDMVITEVAPRNARSLRAHLRVGFQVLHRYRDPDGEDWDLVLWDWC